MCVKIAIIMSTMGVKGWNGDKNGVSESDFDVNEWWKKVEKSFVK